MVTEWDMERIRVWFTVVDVQLWDVGPAQISICICHHHISDCKITLTFDLIFLVNFSNYLMTILALPIA